MSKLKSIDIITEASKQVDLSYSKDPSYLGVLLHNGSPRDFSRLSKGLEKSLKKRGYSVEEISVPYDTLVEDLVSKRASDKKRLFILENPSSELDKIPKNILNLLYRIDVNACLSGKV